MRPSAALDRWAARATADFNQTPRTPRTHSRQRRTSHKSLSAKSIRCPDRHLLRILHSFSFASFSVCRLIASLRIFRVNCLCVPLRHSRMCDAAMCECQCIYHATTETKCMKDLLITPKTLSDATDEPRWARRVPKPSTNATHNAPDAPARFRRLQSRIATAMPANMMDARCDNDANQQSTNYKRHFVRPGRQSPDTVDVAKRVFVRYFICKFVD